MDFLDSLVLASELECAFECREEPDRLVERDRDLADSFLPNWNFDKINYFYATSNI